MRPLVDRLFAPGLFILGLARFRIVRRRIPLAGPIGTTIAIAREFPNRPSSPMSTWPPEHVHLQLPFLVRVIGAPLLASTSMSRLGWFPALAEIGPMPLSNRLARAMLPVKFLLTSLDLMPVLRLELIPLLLEVNLTPVPVLNMLPSRRLSPDRLRPLCRRLTDAKPRTRLLHEVVNLPVWDSVWEQVLLLPMVLELLVYAPGRLLSKKNMLAGSRLRVTMPDVLLNVVL